MSHFSRNPHSKKDIGKPHPCKCGFQHNHLKDNFQDMARSI